MLRMYIKATNAIREARKDISGATAIEYGLIAAGIAVAIVGIVFAIGNDLVQFFTQVHTLLEGAG